MDWLNNRTTQQCIARELTYLDLGFLANLNFEKGLAHIIFGKALEEGSQSLPSPSSISLFTNGVFPNCFPYKQP